MHVASRAYEGMTSENKGLIGKSGRCSVLHLEFPSGAPGRRWRRCIDQSFVLCAPLEKLLSQHCDMQKASLSPKFALTREFFLGVTKVSSKTATVQPGCPNHGKSRFWHLGGTLFLHWKRQPNSGRRRRRRRRRRRVAVVIADVVVAVGQLCAVRPFGKTFVTALWHAEGFSFT